MKFGQITEVVLFVKYMKMWLEIDVMLEIAQALWLLLLWPVQLIKLFGRNIRLITHLKVQQDQKE